MIVRILTVVWLVAVWIALTGRTSPASVVVGCLIAGVLVVYFRPLREDPVRGRLRPWYAVRFLVYFLVNFVRANIQVAQAVVQPERVRHARGVIGVPIAAPSELTTLILANAVSLTPGTFILELRRNPAVMYVHVLQLAGVRAAKLEILDLERRIVLGFGPPGGVDRVRAIIDRVAAEPDDREA